MAKTYIDELVEEIQKLREENQRLRKWVEEFDVLNVAQENQKLKELLEECQHYIVNTPVYPQGDKEKQKEIHILLDKIDEVFE